MSPDREARKRAQKRAKALARGRRGAALRAALEGRIECGVRNYELAALLDVSRQTVWDWTRKGRLPSPARIGRVTVWPSSLVRDLLSGQHTAAWGAAA